MNEMKDVSDGGLDCPDGGSCRFRNEELEAVARKAQTPHDKESE